MQGICWANPEIRDTNAVIEVGLGDSAALEVANHGDKKIREYEKQGRTCHKTMLQLCKAIH